MTELTAVEKLDVQKAIEAEYENSITSYRKWVAASKNSPVRDSTDSMLEREAQEVAETESLMAQFGGVTMDKLTLAERVDIESHLRKTKDHFIEILRNGQSVAGVEVAKTDALLKGFNEVTQRKRNAAIPKSTYTPPPVPPFAGCR